MITFESIKWKKAKGPKTKKAKGGKPKKAKGKKRRHEREPGSDGDAARERKAKKRAQGKGKEKETVRLWACTGKCSGSARRKEFVDLLENDTWAFARSRRSP